MEKTLILIKPDAIEKRITGIILDRMEALGLEIAGARVVSASEELLREHYDNLKGTPYVDGVVKFMRGDYNNLPDHRLYAFVLRGENAVAKVRAAIGNTNPEKAEPWTVRGMFGCIKNGVMQNAIHASGSAAEAQREIGLWFKPGDVL